MASLSVSVLLRLIIELHSESQWFFAQRFKGGFLKAQFTQSTKAKISQVFLLFPFQEDRVGFICAALEVSF